MQQHGQAQACGDTKCSFWILAFTETLVYLAASSGQGQILPGAAGLFKSHLRVVGATRRGV